LKISHEAKKSRKVKIYMTDGNKWDMQTVGRSAF